MKKATKKRYGFKAGRVSPPIEAQTIGEELERVEQLYGEVKPQHVVEEAKPAEAPLHPCFEWRNKVAAEAYRLHQARNIINVVSVVPDNPGGTPGKCETQAYVNVFVGDPGEKTRSYQPIETVLADPDMREQMLARCREKLGRIKNEFQILSEYSRVWQSIDDVFGELG